MISWDFPTQILTGADCMPDEVKLIDDEGIYTTGIYVKYVSHDDCYLEPERKLGIIYKIICGS